MGIGLALPILLKFTLSGWIKLPMVLTLNVLNSQKLMLKRLSEPDNLQMLGDVSLI